MTDKIPPYWVLIEAAKRRGWGWEQPLMCLRSEYTKLPTFQALCDMIERYEQPPVDRKLLCAREANVQLCHDVEYVERYQSGELDDWSNIQTAIRAIELWEEGYGK